MVRAWQDQVGAKLPLRISHLQADSSFAKIDSMSFATPPTWFQDREVARRQWLQDLAIQNREQQEKKQLEAAQRKGSQGVYQSMIEVPWAKKHNMLSASGLHSGSQSVATSSLDGLHLIHGDRSKAGQIPALPSPSRTSRQHSLSTAATDSGDFFWGSRSLGGGGAPLRDRHGHISTLRVRPSSASDEDNSGRQHQQAPIAISAEPTLLAGTRTTPPTASISRTDSNYRTPPTADNKHGRSKTVFGAQNPDEERRREAALEWQATLKEQIAEKKSREKQEKAKADEEERRRIDKYESELNRATAEGSSRQHPSQESAPPQLQPPKQMNRRASEPDTATVIPQRIQRSRANHPSHESGAPPISRKSTPKTGFSRIPRLQRKATDRPPKPTDQSPAPTQPGAVGPPSGPRTLPTPIQKPYRLPTLNHTPRPPSTTPPSRQSPHKPRTKDTTTSLINGSQWRKIKEIAGVTTDSDVKRPSHQQDQVPREHVPIIKHPSAKQRQNHGASPPPPTIRSDSPPLPAQVNKQGAPQPPEYPIVTKSRPAQRRKEPPVQLVEPEPCQPSPQENPPWRSDSPPLRGAAHYPAPNSADAFPPESWVPPIKRRAPKTQPRAGRQHVSSPPPPPAPSQPARTQHRHRKHSTPVSTALDQLRNFSCILMEEQRRMVDDMRSEPLAAYAES
ncbi:hypothetical protein DFJ77DRAFT_14059 [Powellomyces hirtus]|nr:hypothetical protein DFJ77DRAFT_14059 [Powellomyces hirtus]